MIGNEGSSRRLVCTLAVGGYVLSRSVALPGDAADVGNWLEPLGVVALITEGVVVILALLVLAGAAQTTATATGGGGKQQ